MTIVEMCCVHCAYDKVLSPTTKWTSPIQYKQQFSADKKFLRKG